jgi:DNA helicase-2/ATP-dependent DNA helicase PcrA
MSGLVQSINEILTNPKQRAAFSVRSNCVVLAPPGSGKTKLLTTRMASDLRTSIRCPQGAACITLTNAAADELRRRVEALGVENRGTLFVGTVHSFAKGRIVEPYARAVGRPEIAALSIATGSQCDAAYRVATSRVFGNWDDPRFVRSTISVARQRLTAGDAWSPFGDKIRAAAEIYEETLFSQGLCDFSALIAYAVEMVEGNAALRSILNKLYPWLYVDEYQDLSPGLDRLVRALCLQEDAESNLFAVGDPDQAVYAFTGTRPELLNELSQHPAVECVELDRNYRSGNNLVALASRMRSGRVPVTGVREGGSATAEFCPGGIARQIARVVELVARSASSGTPLHEIAVICPQNHHCESVAAELRSANISSVLAETEYRSTASTRMLEACSAWAVSGRETSGYSLSEILRSWRYLLGSEWARADDVRITRLLLDAFSDGTKPVSEFFAKIDNCGLTRRLAEESRPEDLTELERLIGAAATGAFRDLTLEQFADRVRRHNRVAVMNMTVSKGLEFDHVFIIGLDDELVPHYRSLSNSTQLAEDRRKFYVALTRARDQVHMLYSGEVMAPWGLKRTRPSRFLGELGVLEPPI